MATPKDSEGSTSADDVKFADSESNDIENEQKIYSKPREIVDQVREKSSTLKISDFQVFEGFAVIDNSAQKIADFEVMMKTSQNESNEI